MAEAKTCFVISPIGEIGSDTRKRSDAVLKHIIKPALEPEYTVVRADRISQPGITPNQMFQSIIDSDLVVADLTDHNPNVFYELAIRHMISKPSVLLVEVGTFIPFDIASLRVIQYDTNDLDTALEAREKIKEQIYCIDQGEVPVDNPISIAVDVGMLQKSTDLMERTVAEVIETQAIIRREISLLKEAIVHLGDGKLMDTYLEQALSALEHEVSEEPKAPDKVFHSPGLEKLLDAINRPEIPSSTEDSGKQGKKND